MFLRSIRLSGDEAVVCAMTMSSTKHANAVLPEQVLELWLIPTSYISTLKNKCYSQDLLPSCEDHGACAEGSWCE
jgi:hypothetical protein